MVRKSRDTNVEGKCPTKGCKVLRLCLHFLETVANGISLHIDFEDLYELSIAVLKYKVEEELRTA